LDLKNNLSRCYVEALKWICGYYYRGVQSWSWYYPFHYSPFLSDVIVPDIVEPFYKGVPFRPFEQLMAVLPPKTISALPKVLHKIMLDTNSPIIDYFPSEFVIDLVGKRFAWLGEVLLPFIDDERLLKAMGSYEEDLS
jgi:5'-3' exonuclease